MQYVTIVTCALPNTHTEQHAPLVQTYRDYKGHCRGRQSGKNEHPRPSNGGHCSPGNAYNAKGSENPEHLEGRGGGGKVMNDVSKYTRIH